MHHPAASCPLSPQAQECFRRAQEAYRRENYPEAMRENQALADLGQQLACRLTATLGLRFQGLVAYRMGDLDASQAKLTEAAALAVEGNLEEQELLIHNHLGATLRRLGKIREAHDCLRDALRRARGAALREARARLLGNLGALYDELGERARADDCYARYEELIEAWGTESRLANARALAGRSARLRGDLDEAAWRIEDERRLAGNRPSVHLDAACHAVDVALARGDQRAADEAAGQALDAAERVSNPERKRRARFAAIRTALHRKDLPGAERELNAVSADLPETATAERLKLARHRAELADLAGAHGDSLYWLAQAITVARELYLPLIQSSPKGLGQSRISEIKELAREVLEKLSYIAIDEDVQGEIKALVAAVLDDQPDVPPVDVHRWRDRIRKDANALWHAVLCPNGAFDTLHPQSQADLISSQLHVDSMVDDRRRSAHLLATAFERELRLRLMTRVKMALTETGYKTKELENPKHWMLNATLQNARWLALQLQCPTESTPEYAAFLLRLRPYETQLRCIGEANTPFPVCGSTSDLVFTKLRNSVAHGGDDPDLTRHQVDALKRHLFLSELRPFARLLEIPPITAGAAT